MKQHIAKIGKSSIEILGIILLIAMACSYVYHTASFAHVDVENLVVLVVEILFLGIAYGIAHMLQKQKIGMLIWVAFVVALPRLMILYISGEWYPVSDAKIYYDLMQILTENGITTIEDVGISEYIMMFPFIVFYPVMMSCFLDVVGISIHYIQLGNLLMNIATGFLIYGLIKQRTEHMSCLPIIAVLLYACNPTQFLYTPLLYTEHLFMLFAVALLYVYSRYETNEIISRKQMLLYGIAIGVLTWGVCQARVAGLVIVIAMIIYEVLCVWIRKQSIKTTLVVWSIAILIVVLGSKLYSTWVVQPLLLPEHQHQTGFTAYSFYIGMNIPYNGSWNEVDSSQALETVREKGVEQANQIYWNKIITERYGIDLWEYIVLQAKKFVEYHDPAHNTIGYLQAYTNQISIQHATLATYLVETVIVIVLCGKVIQKRQFASKSGLLLLILIGDTLLNMLVETAPRYSYIHAMVLLVLALEQWNEEYLKLPMAETQEKQKERNG